MTSLNAVKNNLIDKILATRNENLLNNIAGIFESIQQEEKVQLSSEQIEMLMMSENDIECGKLISEDELRKTDLEWLH